MPKNKFKKLSPEMLRRVADMFALFSEPARLLILQELHDEEMSVNALVQAVGASQAHVSRQLALLYEGGLLTRERRGTQVFYSIKDPIVFSLCREVCSKIVDDARQEAAMLSAEL